MSISKNKKDVQNRDQCICILNNLLNNDTINPFQSIIDADDLSNMMIQYFKSKCCVEMRDADNNNGDCCYSYNIQKINPRVFGKQFIAILKQSKKPFKIIKNIRLKRGLVYKFNFTKLRQYMEQNNMYDPRTKTKQYKIHFPCYLKFATKPFYDPQLMDRMYCDFFLSFFINTEWKTVYEPKLLPPPPLVFLSVLAFSSEISMLITMETLKILAPLLSNNNNSSNGGQSMIQKMPCVDLFNYFKTFLQMIIDYKEEDEVLNSTICLIMKDLSMLTFGSDMERFLFLPKLGKNQKSNGKMVYHIYIDKIREFLRNKLNKQLDIQSKQLDIQGRAANMEYIDFTDQDSATDEEKDNAEMQRLSIKRAKKTQYSSILRKRCKKDS